MNVITFKDIINSLFKLKEECEGLGMTEQEIENLEVVQQVNSGVSTKMSTIEFNIVSDGKKYFLLHKNNVFNK